MSSSLPIIEIFDSESEIFKVDSEIVADAEIKPEFPIFDVSEGKSNPVSFATSSTETVVPQIAGSYVGDKAQVTEIKSVTALRSSGIKNVTFAAEPMKNKDNITWPINIASVPGTPSIRIHQEKSAFLKTPKGNPVLIPCRYESCGCQEILHRGTILEQDHYQSCNFRPIRCLLHDICEETVPYHNFVLHMISHYVQPTYSLSLAINFFLWAEDFNHDQKWYPKWLSTQGNHFFLMMERKIPGIWISWVWMLGSKEEANAYKSSIFYHKGLRSTGGTFPVYSIHESPEQIELAKKCLLLTDQAMMNLSKIEENVVTDFLISLQISPNNHEDDTETISELVVDTTSNFSELVVDTLSNFSELVVDTMSNFSEVEQKPISGNNSTNSVVELVAPRQPSNSFENFPLYPLIEDGSDFGLEDEEEQGEGEGDGVGVEEMLKIFISNRDIQGFDSSVSTAATEQSTDLDREFHYSFFNDETLD